MPRCADGVLPEQLCRDRQVITRTEAPEGFDILFADLGLSSMQIDDPQRGMSYREDGPLDMRMDERRKQTAADLLGTLSEEALGEALRDLADEPDWRAIAGRIAEHRRQEPLTRAGQLVELVFEVKGIDAADFKRRQQRNPGLLHPAARTFQALRMLVNDELAALKELLRVAPDCLRAGDGSGSSVFTAARTGWSSRPSRPACGTGGMGRLPRRSSRRAGRRSPTIRAAGRPSSDGQSKPRNEINFEF